MIGNEDGAVARYVDKARAIDMDEASQFDHAKVGGMNPHDAAILAQELPPPSTEGVRHLSTTRSAVRSGHGR